MGHTLQEVKSFGAIEAIFIEKDGTMKAVADIRGDDHAAVW
jgi:gamma-glutamyltranspeptidase